MSSSAYIPPVPAPQMVSSSSVGNIMVPTIGDSEGCAPSGGEHMVYSNSNQVVAGGGNGGVQNVLNVQNYSMSTSQVQGMLYLSIYLSIYLSFML